MPAMLSALSCLLASMFQLTLTLPKRQRQTGFTHRLIIVSIPLPPEANVPCEPEVEAPPANSLWLSRLFSLFPTSDLASWPPHIHTPWCIDAIARPAYRFWCVC